LLDKPVGFTPPFPSDLSQKPLMELLARHFRNEEIEDVIMNLRIDETHPDRAANIEHLHTMKAAIDEGMDIHPDERREVKALVTQADQHRIFPAMENDLRILAYHNHKNGKMAGRADILGAKLHLVASLPRAQERLVNMYASAQIGLDMPPEFIETLNNYSKGLESFIDAGVFPSSISQIQRVGRKVILPIEEEVERRNKELARNNRYTMVETVSLEAMGKFRILEALLAEDISRGTMHL
jgi:hypothetical protein